MFQESVNYNEDTLQNAIEAVEGFEANFGGTEIFTPMKSLFDEIKARSSKDYESHIYLLTDGAVYNNQPIIDLVKENCSPISGIKVHTFGVGQGADENLIKGVAFAGLGNYSFIYKDSEIEEKVIESLAKTRLEYLLINKCQILDEDENVISELQDLPQVLAPSTPFNYQDFVVNKAEASFFSVSLYDPNTKQTTTTSRPVKYCNVNGLFNFAAS